MITRSAIWSRVGEIPTEVLRMTSPSSVRSEASTMATWIFPKNRSARLSDLREVEVKILHLVLVDRFAHVLVRLERRTERYSVCLDQCAVHLTARGTARDKAYLEFFPCACCASA